MSSQEEKRRPVSVLMFPSEIKRVQELAKQNMMSMTQYIRQIVLNELTRIDKNDG